VFHQEVSRLMILVLLLLAELLVDSRQMGALRQPVAL
jgi:hypothetical protein